ncbi:BrnA antitoxin family protein [Mesorhizobium sp. 1B3]|uniref:BrnA antitoxin family protein n=1 Tax=Mesorhizobium sp. 1B3 TaxID=3243599 RepID=UPI003D963FF8
MTRFSSKRPLTDEEEAEIQKRIASDPDNPEITDDQARKGKPFAEAFPDLAESIKRSRGRPKVDNAKEAVTLRLSPETLAKFKAKGDDWRARMSEVLDNAEV